MVQSPYPYLHLYKKGKTPKTYQQQKKTPGTFGPPTFITSNIVAYNVYVWIPIQTIYLSEFTFPMQTDHYDWNCYFFTDVYIFFTGHEKNIETIDGQHIGNCLFLTFKLLEKEKQKIEICR